MIEIQQNISAPDKKSLSLKILLAIALTLACIGTALGEIPCCGPITAAGKHLDNLLDESNVENLWLAGHRVDWSTGEAINPNSPYRKLVGTHCSAFVASFAKKLGIYLPRPPKYSQILLANKQYEWLHSQKGIEFNWRRVNTAELAQSYANQGAFVVATYANPDPNKPGHIVIIKPSLKSMHELNEFGPQATQAGEKNFLSIDVKNAFKHHPGAWPNGIEYYENSVKTKLIE